MPDRGLRHVRLWDACQESRIPVASPELVVGIALTFAGGANPLSVTMEHDLRPDGPIVPAEDRPTCDLGTEPCGCLAEDAAKEVPLALIFGHDLMLAELGAAVRTLGDSLCSACNACPVRIADPLGRTAHKSTSVRTATARRGGNPFWGCRPGYSPDHTADCTFWYTWAPGCECFFTSPYVVSNPAGRPTSRISSWPMSVTPSSASN